MDPSWNRDVDGLEPLAVRVGGRPSSDAMMDEEPQLI